MKKGCTISLGLFCLFSCVIVYGFLHAFDPEYSKAVIQQNVGGELLCDATYTSDQHNWQFDVDYKYKDKNGRVTAIGSGTYFEREWPQNEQLIKIGKWLILKTGGEFHCDKLIIGKPHQNNWTDYEFSASNIVKDTVWKKLNIISLVDYLPEEAYITKIIDGQIDVLYKFRIDEKNAELLEEKKIVYKIDSISGKPVMQKVLEVLK